MDDLDALRGLRDDLPALSPLARSRARVKLMNHAAGERPGRAGLFSRLSIRIGLTAATAAAAVAGVGIFGASGSPGTSGAAPVPGSASAAPHTAGATPAPVHVKEAAWSVDTARGGDVRLSMALYSGKGIGVRARTFERTLARAGVPATLRSGVACWENGSALQKRVISFNPVGEAYTVHTSQMPPGSRIVIGYKALPMGGLEWSVAVQAAGYPLHCEKIPDPHWTPQPGWTAPTDDPAHNSRTADGPNAQ